MRLTFDRASSFLVDSNFGKLSTTGTSIGIIYKAECRVNGKIYVGQTRRPLYIRIKRHLGAAGYLKTPFAYALKKHGVASFVFSIIDGGVDLDEKEKYWIAKLNSLVPFGYNSTTGGGGVSGWKASPEICAKVSAAKKGWKMPQAGKDLLRAFHTGRKLSAETRQKLSESHRGYIATEETRRKLSASLMGHPGAFLGRHHTEATKIKMSIAQKGRVFSEEHCRNISAGQRGRKASDETRARMSAAHKKRNQK
jgi:hypothetical protein